MKLKNCQIFFNDGLVTAGYIVCELLFFLFSNRSLSLFVDPIYPYLSFLYAKHLLERHIWFYRSLLISCMKYTIHYHVAWKMFWGNIICMPSLNDTQETTTPKKNKIDASGTIHKTYSRIATRPVYQNIEFVYVFCCCCGCLFLSPHFVRMCHIVHCWKTRDILFNSLNLC